MQKDLFQAISDPTRREIIDLLADRALPVNEVADQFDISRPAISRHIKILKESGLLKTQKKGRRRYCRSDLRRLKKVADWVNQYRAFWTQKLDTLEEVLNEEEEKD